MPVPAAHIRAVIDGYLVSHPEQASDLDPLMRLLADCIDVTARNEWSGHVPLLLSSSTTAGSWRSRTASTAAPGFGPEGILRQGTGHCWEEQCTSWPRRPACAMSARCSPRRSTSLLIRPPLGRNAASPPISTLMSGFSTIAPGNVWHNQDEAEAAAWMKPGDIANSSLHDALALLASASAVTAPHTMPDPTWPAGGGSPMGVYLVLRDQDGRILVGLRSSTVKTCPEM